MISRPTAIAAVVYTAAGITWTQLPLLRTLGYESSFATAILTVCIAGPLTIVLFRRDPDVPFLPKVFRIVRLLMVLLALPLFFLLLSMISVRNCAPLEGAAFYLLLPVCTAVMVAAIGLCAAVYTRFSIPAYFLVVALFLAEALVTAYTTPAVFSYNHLYGYFPGLTYDEALGIPPVLPLYRIWTLAIAALLFSAAGIGVSAASGAGGPRDRLRAAIARLTGPRLRMVVGGVLVLFAVVFRFRCELGFAATASYVRGRLGGEVRTEHFTLYYDREAYSEEEIRLLRQLHEFSLARVLKVFSLATAGPYESYLYGSREQRLELIGAGETSTARPWSGDIHLERETAADVLTHELVHLVAAEFGVPVLNISLSPALLEGLAMAVDLDRGNRTLDEYAAAMIRFGAENDPGTVLTVRGFLGRKSSVSYVLAGSFCRYLISRYGMRAMVRVYRDNDFEEACERSRPALVGEWQAYLDQVPVAPNDSAVVDVLFRSPPIFGKVCPREIGRLRRQAGTLFEQGNIPRARDLYAEAVALAGDRVGLVGLVTSEVRLGSYAAALDILDSVLAADPRPARALPLFLAGGDAAWALGDSARASRLYTALIDVDCADRVTGAAALRRWCMSQPAHRDDLRRYILAGSGDSGRVAILDSLLLSDPHNPCAGLLSAIEHLRSGDAQAALQRIVPSRLPDPLLETIRLRTEARALFSAGRYQEAKARMWESLTYDTRPATVRREEAWIDLCDWMTTHAR